MSDDLGDARSAARYLVTTVATIRALPAVGASSNGIKRHVDELHRLFPEKKAAIRAVETEVKLTRTCAIKCGDLVAPTAHEAAVQLVFALNRERCSSEIEILGRKRIEAWPDTEELLSEIEIEHTKAVAGRVIALREEQPAVPAEASKRVLPLEERALALFIHQPNLTKKEMARQLRCNEKSLAPKRCPKLYLVMKAARSHSLPRGSKGRDGSLEAWSE